MGMSRIIAGILLLLIIIGAVTLGFVFFRGNDKVKVLTITSEGKFDPAEIKLTNDEVLKVENKDDRKHTVRNVGTNSNVVTDLEPNQTSGEIVFDDDSRNQLALVDDKDIRSTVLIGNAPAAPQVEQKPVTPEPSPAPTPSTPPAQANRNEPLPNTGPNDLYIYPLALLAGLAALAFSKRLVPVALPKYKLDLKSRNILIKQPETVLVHFPLRDLQK